MNKEDYDRFLELEGLRAGGIDSGCSDEFEEHEEEYEKLEKQISHALKLQELTIKSAGEFLQLSNSNVLSGDKIDDCKKSFTILDGLLDESEK